MVKKVVNKKGGKRKNAGRKQVPRELKKKPFYVYLTAKDIKALGGKKTLREKIETTVRHWALAKEILGEREG